jgi:hypothetical protein
MKKLMLLPLVLLLAACYPVSDTVETCNITQKNGEIKTWTNVLEIKRRGDQTYVKIAEQVLIDYWIIREYITYDVQAYTCW